MEHHSKLPWKIRQGEFPVGENATIIAQSTSDRCICKIHMHSHEYSKGNAAYIVKSANAYPELVRLLKEWRSAVSTQVQQDTDAILKELGAL
jgi:hypothetical protein